MDFYDSVHVFRVVYAGGLYAVVNKLSEGLVARWKRNKLQDQN